jgi:hypothetical protein
MVLSMRAAQLFAMVGTTPVNRLKDNLSIRADQLFEMVGTTPVNRLKDDPAQW